MVRFNTGRSSVGSLLRPDEIALPLELHGLARIGLGLMRRLDPSVFQDLQRQGIEVGGENWRHPGSA